MTVKWRIEEETIFFEMEATTEGWVAIGFNESTSLAGTYLLMGRVVKGKAEVVEHYTANAGSYKPITQYGITSQTHLISGTESDGITRLKFAIPLAAASTYHKELLPDSEWPLLMAYSLDDDFQHHSIMRTSLTIKL
ncbi:DOMON domain-containing protein [Marivirga sp.]|uniref:DOMON domain-containing protein n=1 Tax=Marivirga sp. TaxID=2018662 RepID=UPI003DA700A5